MVDRKFQVCVTGRTYGSHITAGKHLGTVLMDHGAQVYHVFEVTR